MDVHKVAVTDQFPHRFHIKNSCPHRRTPPINVTGAGLHRKYPGVPPKDVLGTSIEIEIHSPDKTDGRDHGSQKIAPPLPLFQFSTKLPLLHLRTYPPKLRRSLGGFVFTVPPRFIAYKIPWIFL